MRLASPSSNFVNHAMTVGCDGDVDGRNYKTTGFRPLVCLKSDVNLQKQEMQHTKLNKMYSA